MADIPIDNPKTPDIYDFGFTKNLTKDITPSTSTIVYDSVGGVTQAQSVSFGAIIAGAQNSIFIADPSKGIWLGNAQFTSASFRVNMNGDMFANSATIAGRINGVTNRFGGTGSDGALTITSGVTTINLANANVVTKNYSSISITGTGQLAFSNPATDGTIIILKSQGNVTITSSTSPTIDASGMGGAKGNGGAINTDGANGTTGFQAVDSVTHYGAGGTSGGTGVGGSQYGISGFYTLNNNRYTAFGRFLGVGSGGGGGRGSSTDAGGNGGAGGGCVVIECAGDLNCTNAATYAISVAGKIGVNGTGAGANTSGSGGGGSSGMAIVFYATATATTGVINDAGGDGGTAGNTVAGAGGAGGIGGSGANQAAGLGGGGAGTSTGGSGTTAGTGVGGVYIQVT